MEIQNHILNYNGKNENITQFLSESDEQFKVRLEMLKKLEEDKIEWKDALKFSKIYANVKFKNCKYSPLVYNLIKKYL